MNIIPKRKKNNIRMSQDALMASPFSEFRSEMDRLLDQFSKGLLFSSVGWENGNEWLAGSFSPSIDVTENEKTIAIRAEVPGIDPGDVEISISGNTLTIHGEKNEESEQESDDHYHCERRFGTFTRSIELPPTADLDAIEAEQRNGVLTVNVKKQPTEKPKKINVKAFDKTLAGSGL